MTLCGIRFGKVWQASGATNFYGQGWWYHKPLALFGLRFAGTAFVSKTTTYEARLGNMPLKADGVTPKEWVPRCIVVNRQKKAVLNAVSLSGPGLEFLIQSGEWQKRTEPFCISVMSLEKTPEGRKKEFGAIFGRLAAAKKYERFRADWGVQINFSCPNGGVNPDDLIDEVVPTLELAEKCLPDTIPLMPKFGPEAHPQSMARIARHLRCSVLCFSNTLPFGKHPQWSQEEPVNWKGLFGTSDPKESPIAKRFPGFAGGLSGAPLLHFVCEWVRTVRAYGITIPLNAGGGILSPHDARRVIDAGADSIFLGSIAMLMPTQVASTIRVAQAYVRRRA